jgi:mycothiol S-conjugate amidase
VSKLYYDRIISPQRFRAVYDALVSEAPGHPLLASFEEMTGWMADREPANVTTQVAADAFFDVRDSALRAHASQVPPDSPFFFWPNEIQQAVWPWEDFELVRSSVETTLPETDLFAGITDEDHQ